MHVLKVKNYSLINLIGKKPLKVIIAVKVGHLIALVGEGPYPFDEMAVAGNNNVNIHFTLFFCSQSS